MCEVETHAQGDLIGLAGGERTLVEDRPVAQSCEDAQRLIERGEALVQGAARQTVLASQSVVGELVRLTPADNLFVQPVPAGAAEFEVDHEIERDAFGDDFFEPGVQIDGEIGRQDIALVAGRQLRVADADVGCLRG